MEDVSRHILYLRTKTVELKVRISVACEDAVLKSKNIYVTHPL